MHRVLPGQSAGAVQGLVHQRLLQVPALVPEPQGAFAVLQGLPMPPPLPAEPPVPPVPPQNSGNAQALLPLSSSTQQLLLHSEFVVQRKEQKAPRSGKFTHRAWSAAKSQHSPLLPHCRGSPVGIQPPAPALPAALPPVPPPPVPPTDGVLDSSTS